jgi:hypothetical protein
MDDDRTGKEHQMYTVIDVTTGEAVTGSDRIDTGDPVLFDTRSEAEAWATSVGLDDRDHRIEEVQA